MKIVISRKGFDSAFGGVPSPLLHDQRLISLPIPYNARETRRRFADVQFDGRSIGPMVEMLTSQRVLGNHYCHLDPDLRADALCERSSGWRPAFGQADAAAKHLINRGVGIGDVFLFFGLFRQVDQNYSLVAGTPKLHVLHGWLQVDEVITNPTQWVRDHPWAAQHPHTYGHGWKYSNTLYLAKPFLCVDGKETHLPGAGVFPYFNKYLQLTDPRSPSAINWRLPSELGPRAGRTPPTYIGNPSKWTERGDDILFTPGRVTRWQEAAWNADEYPGMIEWMVRLIERHRG